MGFVVCLFVVVFFVFVFLLLLFVFFGFFFFFLGWGVGLVCLLACSFLIKSRWRIDEIGSIPSIDKGLFYMVIINSCDLIT